MGLSPIPASAGPRILVADDDVQLLNFLADFLRGLGYEVDGFHSGGEAVAAMKYGVYDAALVDFQMPDMTGLAVAQKLRLRDEDFNVILMTAHASLDMAIEAIQADVYDYIVKPVDTKKLRRSLGEALEKRRLAMENKRLLTYLEKANMELKQLNDFKSRFLSIVTHDLGQPLTAVKGYAQLLISRKGIPDEERMRCLGIIVNQVQYMDRLRNDLMDFVSISAGKLRVEKRQFSLIEMMQGLRQRLAQAAGEKKVALQIGAKTKNIPAVSMDPVRIEQVLVNLVSNALKHTPAGGRIDLEAEAADGKIRVWVSDTGEGIPKDDLPRVFEEFYQIEAHASKRDGLGLGLAIAREIVLAHGGEIEVFSDGPGKGSRFSFTLPL